MAISRAIVRHSIVSAARIMPFHVHGPGRSTWRRLTSLLWVSRLGDGVVPIQSHVDGVPPRHGPGLAPGPSLYLGKALLIKNWGWLGQRLRRTSRGGPARCQVRPARSRARPRPAGL